MCCKLVIKIVCIFLHCISFRFTNFSILCLNVAKSKVTRSRGKNKKLFAKFKKNNNQPLSIKVDDAGGQYRFVGENASDFVRLISNEIGRETPLYYPSWQDVPDEFKDHIYITLYVSI